MVEIFFKFSGSDLVLSSKGLKGIEAVMNEDIPKRNPYIEFTYSHRIVTIDFSDDECMLDYFTALNDRLGVEMIKK